MSDLRPDRRLVLRLLLAGGALALAACGRKASPIPPPDADPHAPRRYPADRNAPRSQPPEPETETPPQTSPLRSPIDSINQ